MAWSQPPSRHPGDDDARGRPGRLGEVGTAADGLAGVQALLLAAFFQAYWGDPGPLAEDPEVIEVYLRR
jgi:hypothetical protein